MGEMNPAHFFSYVDFLPRCLEAGGMFSQPTYEMFSTLLQRGNEWLSSNPQFVVVTCESVESRASYGALQVDTHSSQYIESGKQANAYHRSLRLWIRMRSSHDPPQPQQLGMYNVIPACLDPGGFLSQPQFEPFNATIEKVNAMFRQNPLPGRILNLETQDMKFSSWGGGVNPERCYWFERGNQNVYFLVIIRIFYVSGPPAHEQIGVADFVPQCTAAGGFFTPSQYEQLSTVYARANRYVRDNPHLSYTNVQTVEYKISPSKSVAVDTMRSLYMEYANHVTAYLRIIRVYHANSLDGSAPPRPAPNLSYRTFTPPTLRQGGLMSIPIYEPQAENMKRVQAWLNYTGARVVSAETVTVRSHGGQYGNSEVTGSYNHGKVNEVIIMMLRLFLDGSYREPPLEVMPPIPQPQQNDDCCAIL